MEKPTDVVDGDDDAVQKKKSDDLWASFLSDVGSRPKDCTSASQSSTTHKVSTGAISESETVYYYKTS